MNFDIDVLNKMVEDSKKRRQEGFLIVLSDGDSVDIRFVPFFYTYKGKQVNAPLIVAQHWLPGGDFPVICNKNSAHIMGKCPICDYVQTLFKDRRKKEAKSMLARRSYVFPVIMVQEPDKGIRVIALSTTTATTFLNDLVIKMKRNPKYNIADSEKGFDFVYRRKGSTMQDTEYYITEVEQCSITKKMRKVWPEDPLDIGEYYTELPIDEAEKIVEQLIEGTYSGSSDDDDDDKKKDKKDKKSKKSRDDYDDEDDRPIKSKKSKDDYDDEDDDDDKKSSKDDDDDDDEKEEEKDCFGEYNSKTQKCKHCDDAKPCKRAKYDAEEEEEAKSKKSKKDDDDDEDDKPRKRRDKDEDNDFDALKEELKKDLAKDKKKKK